MLRKLKRTSHKLGSLQVAHNKAFDRNLGGEVSRMLVAVTSTVAAIFVDARGVDTRRVDS